MIAARDAKGNRFILTRPQDHGPRGYLLYTDVESGETKQYFNPEKVRQGDNFGSILSSAGKFYYDQAGGHVLEFDVNSRETRYLGKPDPATVHFMVYTEAPDGKIYLGSYPNAGITQYDPATGKFRVYGSVDKTEKYIYELATDKNGFVYAGIGTARANIIALNPATGEVLPILPEDKRKLGSAAVVTGDDGYAYGRFGDFQVKLLDGKIVEAVAKVAAPKPIKGAKYGNRLPDFGDGTRVAGLDLYTKEALVREKNGKLRVLKFDYQSGGLDFTSLAMGPGGKFYGSTSHPMHFVELDTASGKIVDHGPNPIVSGGNFCNMTASADKLFACEYAGGRLWVYDPKLPIRFGSNGLTRFGATPSELAMAGSYRGGTVSALNAPPILFCNGGGNGAEFRFPLTVEADGEYYLNCQFFENGNYGTVKLAFEGKEFKRNLQNLVDRPSPMVALGPFRLKKGSCDAVFTVDANPGGRAWFGIVGLALEKEPRRDAVPDKVPDNPRILGRWKDLVTRPRAINIHPDGKHVVIAGYANYGLNGGGFGIHDLSTGENREIAGWMPGESCIAFRFLPGGDIVGGTSNAAPGGGYKQVDQASLFRLDWKTGKVSKKLELPGVTEVVSVELWNGKLVAVTANGELLALDPETFAVLARSSVAGLGTPPRNALQKSGDGRLLLLQYNGIQEIDPVTLTARLLARGEFGITAGGGCRENTLYFGCGREFAKYELPPKK
ncbi:MAG: hypothetical protein AB7F32_09040 [Victivallaceae bacterium]